METDKLLIMAVVAVNAIATALVGLQHTIDREAKVWQLYTASVTGLYGYALANDRNRKGRNKDDENREDENDSK